MTPESSLLKGVTPDDLDEIADTFYGMANNIAYTAGPSKYSPKDTWPDNKRAEWDRVMEIAERFSREADVWKEIQ